MAAKAQTSISTVVYSVLSASAGYAIYGWWRHGEVNWVAVIEFALGWGVATVGLQWIGRLRQKRKRRQEEWHLVHEE